MSEYSVDNKTLSPRTLRQMNTGKGGVTKKSAEDFRELSEKIVQMSTRAQRDKAKQKTIDECW